MIKTATFKWFSYALSKVLEHNHFEMFKNLLPAKMFSVADFYNSEAVRVLPSKLDIKLLLVWKM